MHLVVHVSLSATESAKGAQRSRHIDARQLSLFPASSEQALSAMSAASRPTLRAPSSRVRHAKAESAMTIPIDLTLTKRRQLGGGIWLAISELYVYS
jgi:hypothetical protein